MASAATTTPAEMPMIRDCRLARFDSDMSNPQQCRDRAVADPEYSLSWTEIAAGFLVCIICRAAQRFDEGRRAAG